ncbi:UDP-N-acetylglucosamine 2-epimerase [Paraburkholderia sp. MM5384-R2]|nr:UDP-N-acetylglucosamine 2-epimerase [Paraburkholderia sp. MM5384-R2]
MRTLIVVGKRPGRPKRAPRVNLLNNNQDIDKKVGVTAQHRSAFAKILVNVS